MKSPSFTTKLAALGEELQDGGNGQIRVTTHAGLVVTISIRERHPMMGARDRLVRIWRRDKPGRHHLVMPTTRAWDKMLAYRKLVTIDACGIVTITKAGRIAAERFAKMDLVAKRRERAAAKARKA